jgi:hypothetical protein
VLFPPALLVARRRVWGWLRGRQDRICLVLGAYASTGFCFIDFQGSPDRLFVVPFIAVANAVVLGAALVWIRGKAGVRIPGVAAAAVVVAVLVGLVVRLPFHKFDNRSLDNQRAAAAYVGGLLNDGKTVYVVSALHLLAMNRASNFNYYGFYPIRIRAFLTERLKREGHLLPLKNGKLPDVVLQSRMEFPPNQRWIERYYRIEKSHVMKKEKVTMMVLRDDVKPPSPLSKAF